MRLMLSDFLYQEWDIYCLCVIGKTLPITYIGYDEDGECGLLLHVVPTRKAPLRLHDGSIVRELVLTYPFEDIAHDDKC